jgi:hypothetical protein
MMSLIREGGKRLESRCAHKGAKGMEGSEKGERDKREERGSERASLAATTFAGGGRGHEPGHAVTPKRNQSCQCVDFSGET